MPRTPSPFEARDTDAATLIIDQRSAGTSG
jgi:hypothetical protein